VRVFGRKTVHRQAPETLCETLGETEVQLTNRIGVAGGNLRKRTATEYEVDLATSLAPGRAEATSDQLLLHSIDGIADARILEPPAEAILSADLARTAFVLHRVTKQAGEPRIGSGCLPFPGRLRVQPVEQARTARSVTDLDLLNDEFSFLQHGEMLTHGVVVQLHIRCQLCHSYGSIGVDDVAEQAIASRIPDCPRLALNVCRIHVSPHEVFGCGTLDF
jgi:hypothetical protein